VTIALIAIIILVLAVTWGVELRRLVADLRARLRDERAIGS
jgi:flagellar biogenesis protein FliO